MGADRLSARSARRDDPLGRTDAQAECDEDGRLIKLLDANGNGVELDRDLESNRETLVDALGRRTEHWYDDTGAGRFYGADPLKGDLGAPASLHWFTYAENNPVSLTDPTGLYSGSISGLMTSIVVLGVLSATACGRPTGHVPKPGVTVSMPLLIHWRIQGERVDPGLTAWPWSEVCLAIANGRDVMQQGFRIALRPEYQVTDRARISGARVDLDRDDFYATTQAGNVRVYLLAQIYDAGGECSNIAGKTQRGRNVVWMGYMNVEEHGDRINSGRTLAHELGHTLSLFHEDDPGNLMYRYSLERTGTEVTDGQKQRARYYGGTHLRFA